MKAKDEYLAITRMTPSAKPFRRRVGARPYTLTVEPAGDRWYAEARHLGALVAAGSGDAPDEALAFVQALLGEAVGCERARAA